MRDPVDSPAVVAESQRLRRRVSSSARPHVWLLRRLLLGLLTLLVVSVLIFTATQALPGDAARSVLGRDATPTALAAVRKQLSLDRPVTTQYVSWLSGAVRGDFGNSLVANVPVTQLLGSRVRNSFLLLLISAGLAVPLAIWSGVLAASGRDRFFDRALLSTSLLFTAVPEFVVGLLLVMLFSTTILHWLPAVVLVGPNADPLSHPSQLILPIATLVLAVWPYLFRLVRASMIDVLESDYVQTARIKGMPGRRVLVRHALPNALVPAVQGTALVMAYLLGGIVVIEFLFNYPGLGSGLIDAVSNRDIPVIQASVLVFAASYVVFNIVADILTVFLTPRLRTAVA